MLSKGSSFPQGTDVFTLPMLQRADGLGICRTCFLIDRECDPFIPGGISQAAVRSCLEEVTKVISQRHKGATYDQPFESARPSEAYRNGRRCVRLRHSGSRRRLRAAKKRTLLFCSALRHTLGL